MTLKTLNVGIVGGGLGGLTAATAAARAGAKVIVLEAASELGEIGAGIQMFGNVSRFLVRTGIDKIIGDNLVAIDELRTWGTGNGHPLIGRINPREIERDTGFPWWVIRRDHLHAGLAEGARRHGVKVIVGFRVNKLDHGPNGVTVTSQKGVSHQFDLVVGADGVKSILRQKLFPNLKPLPASNIAAYRAVVPYEEVFRQIPEARSKIGNTMDAWCGPGGYILLYPLTAGKELNVVTSFEQNRPVTELEEINIQDWKDHYKDFDPFILKVLDLVPSTKKWPLLVIPPTDSWSSEHKNVVLMGDAAHAMQNHMAQGAATAMEDGMFLGRVISEVVRGSITLAEAIHLYELKRMPRVWVKQQSAFVKGEIACAKDEDRDHRDAAMAPEVKAWDINPAHPVQLPATYRTWQMMASPSTVPGILYYDAEGDADFAVCEFLQNKGDMDPKTLVSKGLRAKWWSAIYDNGMDRAGVALKAKL